MLRQDKEDVSKYCKYTFQIHGKQSDIVTLISTRPTPQILLNNAVLSVTCDGRSESTVNCTNCMYALPPGCSATSKNFYVAAMHTHAEQNETELKHIANIIWLEKILSENQKQFLKDIDMTELLDQQIQISNLPTLKTLNASLHKIFASADDNILDLEAAAHAIKSESQVIQNLAQAAYYGSAFTAKSWTDDFGIVLITICVVVGLIIPHEIYM